MVTTPMTTPKRPLLSLAVAALSLVALAGCADFVADDDQTPEAVLDASKTTASTGEALTFDAQASSDPNGRIVEYVFDFGDGETMTVTDEDDARVEHTYRAGGAYVVTVEVRDDGEGQEAAKSDDASVQVYIDEVNDLPPRVVTTLPDANGTEGTEYAFEVREDALHVVANLTLDSVVPLGDSTLVVRIEDPDGVVLAEQEYTVGAGQTLQVDLGAEPAGPGDHLLVVEARSGGAGVDGQLTVRYAPDAMDAPDAEPHDA